MIDAGVAPIRVLMVEDNPSDAELEVRELKRAGLRVEYRVTDSEESCRRAIAELQPDVILSDFAMPHFDGMAALVLARTLCPDTPFIFVSGTLGEDYAIRALKNGATDYVLKSNLVRLPAAVERALLEARERKAARADRDRLARLSRIRDFSSGINAALVRLRERDALFEEICRIAVRVGGFLGAHIGVLRGEGTIEWLVRHGTSVEHLAPVAVAISADAPIGRTIGGVALRSGRPAVWNDVARDPGVPERDRPRFLASGIGAAGSFPLMVEAKPIALLGLHAHEPGFFDEDQLRLLEELTANISFGLELIAHQARIRYLAMYDSLTGLPNRTLFQESLTHSIREAATGGTRVALVLMDLERFKSINDTLGQRIGDQVLAAVAQRIQHWAGGLERVARLGGNLFALTVGRFQDRQDIVQTLEQATTTLFGTAFDIEGREVRLTAKSAIALYPDDGASADVLFRNAEAALQQVKETRERSLFYTADINARVSEQMELEHRLRKAVDNGELFLHFQPKVDLATRAIVGLEALMRWQGPDGSLVPPAKFVPILEQTGLILEAGQQVLRSAGSAHRDWKAKGLNSPRIAVNVSALQLLRTDFVEDVRRALGSTIGDDGGGIDLEVTESLLMTSIDQSIRKLRELREMGMCIALDDFGTGFSSLSYLTRLPIDTLKIDRSFVHGMTENADHTSIVSAIISLAQALRFKVVAEGVETEQQAQLLRLLRCDQAQGYLFNRPVSRQDIESLIAGGL